MIRATLADVQTVNAFIERDSPGTDFSELLADPLHVCLIEGDGGAIFLWRGPGIYEVHVFFGVRGGAVLDLSARMLDHMRENYGARLFWGAVPPTSRKVKLFTRWMGWKSQGVLETRLGPFEMFISENI